MTETKTANTKSYRKGFSKQRQLDLILNLHKQRHEQCSWLIVFKKQDGMKGFVKVLRSCLFCFQGRLRCFCPFAFLEFSVSSPPINSIVKKDRAGSSFCSTVFAFCRSTDCEAMREPSTRGHTITIPFASSTGLLTC